MSQPPPPPAAPIADGLFTWNEGHPELLGSRCDGCGAVAFPAQRTCPRCPGLAMAEISLGREGTLWSWTIQGFRPPSPPYRGPADFEPFGLGYVEMPTGVRVEARLTTAEPDELRIGMPMELVLESFPTHDGEHVLTFAFAPAAQGGTA